MFYKEKKRKIEKGKGKPVMIKRELSEIQFYLMPYFSQLFNYKHVFIKLKSNYSLNNEIL